MWLKKIRKRKFQFFLIAMILMLSTAILIACTSFAWETGQFAEEYYDVSRCPIKFAILAADPGTDLLSSDENLSKLIDRVDTCDAKLITTNCYKNGEKLENDSMILYGMEDRNQLGYALPIAKGKVKDAPEPGEIWICHVYADAVKLRIGDTISFGETSDQSYEITAIVNTPECNSGFLDNYPCYMNPEDLAQVEGMTGYGVQIYAKNNDISVKEINEALPKQFSEAIVYSSERDSLKMCLSLLATIFGGVGSGAALIILSVSIIILRYLIRATIAKEYKMIGVYKSIGRTTKEVKSIYFISYLVPGIIGSLIGLAVGRPLALYLSKMVLGGNEGFRLSYRTMIISIGTLILMCGLLALNIFAELRKIGRITPIQTLSIQNLSSKEKLCRSVLPNAHSAAACAINGLLKKRGMTMLVIMILTVSFYINLVACAVGLTLGNYKNDQDIWENFPAYDGYIKINEDKDVEDYLKNCSYVEDYVAIELSPSCTQLEIEGSSMTNSTSNPMVYDNFTEERYRNVPFTKGRICLHPHEITCSEDFLKEVKKSVGDYIKIKADDQQIDFLIVGSYSAMMKGGTSFYIQRQDMEELGCPMELPTILFFLKDSVTYDEFRDVIEQKFDTAKVGKRFAFVAQEGKTVTSISNPICRIVFFAFLAFSILNVINLVYTQNREYRKKYGILKALGFTTGYIRCECMVRLTIESAIAVIITIVLQETLSPVLFSLACGVKYILKPVWLTAALCSGMFLIIAVITWLMLLPVSHISPVELMDE